MLPISWKALKGTLQGSLGMVNFPGVNSNWMPQVLKYAPDGLHDAIRLAHGFVEVPPGAGQ